ncbi:MAG: CocE/NonD family hydrolase [Chloroflexi bacterium OHK40]
MVRAIVERNVPATMRDGVTLYADVWRPAAPGRYPVLLQRLPYNKALTQATLALDPFRAVEAGYGVIIQDTRGRYTSEGHFTPLIHEADDGYDSVEWAARLPWSNGQVGMVGGSYMGAAQWLAALRRPPHLRALFPQLTPNDYHDGWAYEGGAWQLGFLLHWTLARLALDGLERRARAGEPVDALRAELLRLLTDHDATYRQRPLRRAPLRELARFYDEWLEHGEHLAFWEPLRLAGRLGAVGLPAYHLGGWYDLFARGTLAAYSETAAGSAPQKLLMGPWTHLNSTEFIGERDFGPVANQLGLDLTALQLRWFDHWLKGRDSGLLDEPPIRIFVMGANCWRWEHEWPLARSRYTPFYLHSAGSANSARGDGMLSQQPPLQEEPADCFVYDPDDPVPTRGGATLLPGFAIGRGAGPYEQATIESRQDVLVYTSPPLTEDLEVTGPIVLELYARSSARDTDWTAKLTEVFPDGRSYNLVDGILRARYRNGLGQPMLIEPGAVLRYTIQLGPTSNRFKAGHRIRLQVSSSNFPRFDPHPNTAGAIALATQTTTARQEVLHTPAYPSHLLLPVIP